MNWEEVKNKVKTKCSIREIDPDTIEFSLMGKNLRIHRFEIPDGFLVAEGVKEIYNGKLVLLEKINNEWRLFHHGY